MGGQKSIMDQQEDLDFASTFTYILWKVKRTMGSARGDLDFASTFTYIL
jgi:hypothetical protein